MAKESVALDLADILRILETGEIEVLGRMPYASNATFLTRVTTPETTGLGVYKPRRGESPLWDFPPGTLYRRERAAWVVDAALGWDLVPPTVVREGPAGIGALQLFVEETAADLDDVLETHEPEMRRMAAFDAVVNNADRKGGHCLLDTSGRLWGIDHGVTFNVDSKLRTVIWVFAGDRLGYDLLSDLERFRDELCTGTGPAASELRVLLDRDEVEALVARVERLLRSKRFPEPGPGRRHVPWPPW